MLLREAAFCGSRFVSLTKQAIHDERQDTEYPNYFSIKRNGTSDPKAARPLRDFRPMRGELIFSTQGKNEGELTLLRPSPFQCG